MDDATAPRKTARTSATPSAARSTGPGATGPDATEPPGAGTPAAPPPAAGPPVPEPYLTELAAGVHAFIQPDGGWCLNNAGFVTDGDATLVVDTAATERRARLLRQRIAESGAPAPRTVVNTHHHGDHTYGNGVFAPEATVIGHASCRRELLAAGHQLHAVWPEVEYGDIHLTPPEVTYTDELTLHVGEIEVRLIHPGVAHTTGDTVVWLPRERIVFAGDLVFHGGTPFLFMGSLAGSLRAVRTLRALDAVTVVPGHGPVTGPEVYDGIERYLRFVGRLAQEGRAAGRTPLETAQEADLGPFAELAESERLVANLHRAYAELAGAAPGVPLDPMAAFADMAVLNDGVPMACHA
ncbi:MBL fold metallo-hydrolase [Streptomyces sp. Isolate_219]|uniref:MBL fold metallo-hydrolase n=1 Tax=Streptomyces sp. Isolate_219 TaxID=2950110 RepID=UPI0021C78450|nr:MBL fold metallo-hydrolase [Streptomyces sp. Isolate_219]MCR8575802.1 MBL fold metallo-hydrolase [Streptomyces sp. Isolate_219]